MYLKPYLKYLKPHRYRLVVAILGMMLVSVMGIFNLTVAIGVLESMFPAEKKLIQAPQGVTTATLAIAPAPEEKEEPSFKKRMQAWLKATTIGAWFTTLRDDFYANYAHADADAKMRGLMILCAVLVISGILKGLCEYLATWALSYAFFKMTIKMREDLFAHIMKLDYLFFSRHSTGFLESRIYSDITGIRTILQELAKGAIQEPFNLIGILFFLFIISPTLTLIIVCIAPMVFLLILFFGRIVRKYARKQRKRHDMLSQVMEEALRNFKVVQTYHTYDYEIQRFVVENARIFKYWMKGRMAKFASSPIIEVLGTMGAALVILLGGYMILGESDGMDAKLYLVYLVALSRIYRPVRRITNLNITWQQGRVSAERMGEMFANRSGVAEAADARPLPAFKREVNFNNVSFSYGEKKVLDGLSFNVPKGRIVAIVGKTGAGKTTLVNMLPRLFDPSEGGIEIDGADLRDYRLADLRRLFGIVTQEIILFNESVTGNIAYADPAPDLERVKQAARAANAEDFILELDGGKGYDTNIGMGGQKLSGGQRQRLAIARAIYRDPQILIFDEATSSLDEQTQQLVQQAIDNLLQGRTAFVIAHRLSTIRHADEILVLDNGRLIERGTHQELLAQKTYYSNLYNLKDDLD